MRTSTIQFSPRRLLGHAAAFAARGWPVFPVNADKSPACAHGHRDATVKPQRVTALFRAAPSATLAAIATGKTSGVAAIDIDPAGMAWFAARRQLFRPTWQERTPRGGLHLLYEYPPGLRCSAGKLAKGVDIRAENGSCILWGPGYEIMDGRDPTPFPAWILATLAAIDRKRQCHLALRPQQGTTDIDALIQFVRQSQAGERSNRLFWAACRAGEKAAALLPAAIEVGLLRREAEATIRSGIRTVRHY